MTTIGVEYFTRSRMIIVWTQKGCSDRLDAVIGWICLVVDNLGSLLDVIELTILCPFVCRVRYTLTSLESHLCGNQSARDMTEIYNANMDVW